MQKNNKFFEDLAGFGTAAAGSLLDFKREIEQMINKKIENLLTKQHFVSREEYETVWAMANKAREENEKLEKRLSEVEKIINK